MFQLFTGKSGVGVDVCVSSGPELGKPTSIMQEGLRMCVFVTISGKASNFAVVSHE